MPCSLDPLVIEQMPRPRYNADEELMRRRCERIQRYASWVSEEVSCLIMQAPQAIDESTAEMITAARAALEKIEGEYHAS